LLEFGNITDEGRVKGGIVVPGGERADGAAAQVKRTRSGDYVCLQFQDSRRRSRADAGDAQPSTGRQVVAFEAFQLHRSHAGSGENFFFGGKDVFQVRRAHEALQHPNVRSVSGVQREALEMSRETLRAAKLSDELRESEARMTLAAEAAAFGVWIWTTANDRVWASERALHLFGFERGADVSYEMIFERIHPDDREKAETALRHAMETGASYASEYRVNLPDGTVRWIEAQGRTHPNGGEKAARMLGAVVDITERKQAEQDLAQHRSEVAHLSRVTTLGEISGSLAHELGQPLGAILTNTDSIEMHLRNPAPNLDEVHAILADSAGFIRSSFNRSSLLTNWK
jgi:PAS domain S-box-containing protein